LKIHRPPKLDPPAKTGRSPGLWAHWGSGGARRDPAGARGFRYYILPYYGPLYPAWAHPPITRESQDMEISRLLVPAQLSNLNMPNYHHPLFIIGKR